MTIEDSVDAFLADHPPAGMLDRDLRRARFDCDLAFPHFDCNVGGIGAPVGSYAAVERIMLATGAVLGSVGDGRRVAMTTLMNERSSLGSSAPDGGHRPIDRALDLARRPGADVGSRADRLAAMLVDAEVAAMHARRVAASPGVPGPGASILKLL